jgi:16S rRNA (guanine(966)-N(2))-methyltransferase RsmD
MRIISGRARGLKLNTPKNDDIRPTTDRVKESLFNIINSRIPNSQVLDLFAGTGGLGLECLSRGAEKCTFVDSSRESVKVLTSNIEKARFKSESEVITADFMNALNTFKVRGRKFDLVFLDPPYHGEMFIDALTKLDEADLLEEHSLISVEHDTADKFPEKIGRLYAHREKKYGKTTITFYMMGAVGKDE